ncbi:MULTISPECIES: hypothetical protein [Streptomyces]|uniref:Uncharacterized protein n=1 Tax=Streptomyces canarius TaxID=285453 RepID=A0ABQ3CF81_9ACTN|nr:hypothetical protein [Streptomyces canarius]GHA09255.1 hypothetical protein GCM10010345_12140 [Streptomyces canarius]
MPTTSRPCGQLRTALDGALADVNDRIRRLMGQPASKDRTQAYQELLTEWGDRARADVEPAA